MSVRFLPLVIAAIFGGALHVVGRRHPRSNYVSSWTAAFELLAAGWLVRMWTDLGDPGARPAGSAAGLIWLAASLLFVMGLRQRARRRDRALVLAAIWAAIAATMALRSDLWERDSIEFAASTPLLVGIGLLLTACAIRRRGRRGRLSDWAATMSLVGYAASDLVTAARILTGADQAIPLAAAPLVATVAYVALGVILMLMLNEDLAIALERVARTDPLTGIWNRRGFDEGAPHLLRRMQRAGGPRLAAVAIADIDAFKSINDGHGHATGDAVLAAFARLLSTATEQDDLLARLGGEEFALLVIGVDAATLFERVEHIRCGMTHLADDGRQLPRVTASFGVAALDPASLSIRDALERADRALYRAKQSGRNRTLIDDPAWVEANPPATSSRPRMMSDALQGRSSEASP